MKRSLIILTVVVAAVVATGAGVLTWWLLKDDDNDTVTTIELDGSGFGELPNKAGFTRIPEVGEVFWWFHPTTSKEPTRKPVLLWLDGILGVPPSLLANFGMFGPYDINMNRREDSWVTDYNLLFVDAPLGTGFSTLNKALPEKITLEKNAEYLQYSLDSFFGLHDDYKDTPLYIVGQGHGAQIAVALAKRLHEVEHGTNLKGVLIGNGIIAPGLVLTELATYLEQWGYVDGDGRGPIEQLSKECNDLIAQERYDESYSRFLNIGKVVNDEANALAINMGHIVEKLSNDTNTDDYSFYQTVLRYVFPGVDSISFMNEVVAPALGVSDAVYDSMREDAMGQFKDSFMKSSVETVESLLQNTNLTITIFNGNLDAVSNTPGQLAWVQNLQWSGQEDFKNSRRETFVLSNTIQGYYRQTDRLAFYWINAAGLLTPLDSPATVLRLIEKSTNNKI